MEKAKPIISFLSKAVLVGAVCLLAGFLLMIGVYMLPTGRMKSHVAESDEIFNYEGIYPQLMHGMKSSQLDNYTDALMYATAIHPGNGKILWKAMYNARYEYEDTDMVQSLNDYANDASGKEPLRYEIGYARYWHGYLVILKPLLLFLNVSEIRLLNQIMQTFFLSWLLCMVIKKYGIRYVIPIIMMVLVLNPVVMPLSLQYSWVYYISLLGSIFLVGMKQQPESEFYLLLFMVLGMSTSYFDLLTYPMITLGLPLVMFLLKCRECKSVKKIIMTISICVIWFAGYAVMWIGKWVLAFVFAHINLSQEVSDKISERTSMAGELNEPFTLWTVIGKPLSVVLTKPYVFAFICLFIGYFMWIMFQRRKSDKGHKNNFKETLLYLLPYMFIAFIPFARFCVLSNHTYAHYWFVYRELSVTVLAIGTMALELAENYFGENPIS